MRNFFCIALLLNGFFLKAQENVSQAPQPQIPIPVEVMAGAKSGMYQMIVHRPFASGSNFKFFNLINYEVDYDDATPNNYIIQTIGSYEFAKGFDVGIGGNLKTFGGFKPIVSASYSNFSKVTGILIQPVYEINKDGEFSLFSLFEWHPVGEKKLQPYFSIQVLTAWASEHAFSYHYWRLGAQYKILRFGPALNVQYHGENYEQNVNWGGFINILIR